MAKGSVRVQRDPAKLVLESVSRADFRGYITVHLAGMVADELWNGKDQVCKIGRPTHSGEQRGAGGVLVSCGSLPHEFDTFVP